MQIEELVGAFASAANIDHVSPVDGIWKFSADGLVFGITADDTGESVFLFAELPRPVPDRENAFRKAVLEANFFGRGTCGAVFSLNPDTGAFTLVLSEKLDRLQPKSFFSLVEKFLNTLASWSAIASAAKSSEPSPPPQDKKNTSPSNPDSFNLDPFFMRI